MENDHIKKTTQGSKKQPSFEEGDPRAAEIEPNKSVAIKLQKLAVTLGKPLRVQLGLPSNLKECILELQKRTLANALCNEPG